MVKNTKKSTTTNHGQPITSFFTRTSKAPSQDVALSSEATSSTIKSSVQTKSVSPGPHDLLYPPEKVPKAVPKSLVPQQPATSAYPVSDDFPQASATLLTHPSSLKRSRVPELEPETKILATRQRSGSFKSDDHKKGKFDSDSDVEQSSVHVMSPPTNTQRRKKARLFPLEHEASPALPVIPSSQSEEELILNTPDTLTQRIVPQFFCRHPSMTTPDRHERSMVVESDNAEGAPTSAVARYAVGNLPSQGTSLFTEHTLPLPPSDVSSLPTTPNMLDAATKTARIIAEIKAKAYADTGSSPETVPFEFNEKLDSSSEEEDLVTLLNLPKKETTNPGLVSVQPTRRSTRYTSKYRSQSSPSKGLHRNSNILTSPNQQATRTKKRVDVANPFTALLKEKNMAEKHGGGNDVFRRAELIASNIGKHSEGEDTDMDTDEDTIDWDAAARTARRLPWIVENPSSMDHAVIDSPRHNLAGDEHRALSEQNSDRGQNILQILESDKVSQKELASSQTKAGIRIWESPNATVDYDGNRMAVEEDTQHDRFLGDSAGVQLFNKCLSCRDTLQASWLLEMDMLFSLSASESSGFASSLCSFALSPHSNTLGEPATRALERFWGSSFQKSISTMHFTQILESLNKLGLDASILASQDWEIRVPHLKRNIVTEKNQREDVIRRLLLLVVACASSERLEVAEIPNLVLALLLLGMDTEASPDVLEDVTRAVNLVCHCVRDEDQNTIDDICLKILRCVGPYTPINKARMISLLSAGSGVSHRVASIVSYNIITENHGAASSKQPPALADIVNELIAYTSPKDASPIRKFSIRNETNYDDVGHYIFILGVAVSNIRGYVSVEVESKSNTLSLSRSECSTKTGEKQGSDVQMLIESLEKLHNKISDTRAAHLERSRAKANIKGLSMIIHYQQRYWHRNDTEGRAKTLAQYFKKKT